jgi:bifunctional enzyme CysN/CysC
MDSSSPLSTERALPIVVVGHVDHGKSTLVGRILHDTNSLPKGRLEQLRKISKKRGLDLEFSFLLDSLQVERDQGITVDSAQIWFSTAVRRYVIIDAPGHTEFLRNMVTGAAAAQGAVLVVDAAQGVSEQTRRHGYLLGILGVRQVVVAVNRIDLIGHAELRFNVVAEEARCYLRDIGIEAATIIPLSAKHGDNIQGPSVRTPWYQGPALLPALDAFRARPALDEAPLRLPVQDLYRQGDRRIIAGRIEAGTLTIGQKLCFAPGNITARVATLEAWGNLPRNAAGAGESIAFTLDREVFIERGQVAVPADAPLLAATRATVRLFWLDAEPLVEGERVTIRYGTAQQEVTVEAIEAVIDVAALSSAPGKRIGRNAVGRARLRARRPLALDLYSESPRAGRGVLVRHHRVVGGFVVEGLGQANEDLTAVDMPVTPAERAARNGHRGGVLWLTGLSGAGKSTLATRAVRVLQDDGWQAQLLDGDNLRLGLNRDLGFSDADRSENVRRTAEVAKLLAESGFVVLVALISPLAAQRDVAREIIGESFREVFVDADLATCAARDPKGLYAKNPPGLTGVSAPYEAPSAPALHLRTGETTAAFALAELLRLARASFG